MSGENAPRASSDEATSGHNGNAPSADESSTGRGEESAAAQPEPPETDTNGNILPIRNLQKVDVESNSRSNSKKRQRQTNSQKTRLSSGLQAYRNVLNEEINLAAQRTRDSNLTLPSSQIGASFWTSTEKEAFFGKLAVSDLGNLRALSNAVGTKSEAECHVYLRLLQAGVLEESVTLPPKNGFSFADVPAAMEVQERCEVALDEAAETLSRQVERNDEELERQKHGDTWLIDGDLTEVIEDEIQLEKEVCDVEEEAQPESGNSPGTGVEIQRQSPKTSSDGTTASTLSAIPSARLLQSAAFLALTSNLFMNGPPDTGRNWRDLPVHDDRVSTPAIYRTAFDDFYNLTVSLTRRLVQVSLFQALSRTRANDGARANRTPKVAVSEMDVRTALDVLGMRDTEWKKRYWATIARRCGVDVYSDSKKFRDGRTGTKNGVKLTLEEVEAELGSSKSFDVGSDGDVDDRFETTALEIDSDAFTFESCSEDSASTADPAGVDRSVRTDGSSRPSKRRKRITDPQDHERAERAYLESLDQQASLSEERRLWEVLGESETASSVKEVPDVLPPLLNNRGSATGIGGWRAGVVYEAEWERFPHPVQRSEFETMEVNGAKRRKRRHATEHRVREALERSDESVAEQDTGDEDGDGHSSDEETFAH